MSETAIVRQMQRQPAGWDPTPEQEKMVRDMFLGGAPANEAAVLLEIAKARRLNPLTRQIHFVKRWDAQRQAEMWSAQVGIDGFRAIAERTGQYDGQDEPEFEHDKQGRVTLCRVRVYRKDWSRPAVGVAYFSEYVQTKKGGEVNAMWARGPHFMLAKCAESLALRKAFPEDLGGLYEPAELSEAVDAAPSSPRPVSVSVAVSDAKPVDPASALAAANALVGDAVKGRLKPRATMNGVAISKPGPIVDVAEGQTEDEAKVLARRRRRIRETGQQAGYDASTWPKEVLLPALGADRKHDQWTAEDCDKLEKVLGIAEPPVEPGAQG